MRLVGGSVLGVHEVEGRHGSITDSKVEKIMTLNYFFFSLSVIINSFSEAFSLW